MFNSTAPIKAPQFKIKTEQDVSKPKYLFFWKPNGPNGMFSQWFPAPMVIDGISFANCEQYMMYQKALLFDDMKVASACLKTDNPKTLRALGRKVTGFDEKTWEDNRYKIVHNGNFHKFTQNKQLLNELLKNKGKTFVEASPSDRIWGIGYAAAYAINNKDKWGFNLLGQILTDLSNTLEPSVEENEGESLFDLEPCTNCPMILTKPKLPVKCNKSAKELLE